VSQYVPTNAIYYLEKLFRLRHARCLFEQIMYLFIEYTQVYYIFIYMHNQYLVTNNANSLFSRTTEGIESNYRPTIIGLMSVDKKK